MSPATPDTPWIVLFDSIHYVLAAEQALKERSVWCDLVPVPRNLHSDCGMAVAFRSVDREAVCALLADPRLGRRRIFRRQADDYVELLPPSPGTDRRLVGRGSG